MSDMNAMVKQLVDLRGDKKKLEFHLTELGKAIEGSERTLMEAMSEQGMKSVRTEDASVTMSEAVYPQVEDRDAYKRAMVEEIIAAKEAGEPMEVIMAILDNFQFRLSVPRAREKFEMGIPQPGVVPFVKQKLTVRV